MKFIILSLVAGGIVALPLYTVDALVMSQLESLEQSYRGFEAVAQDVAADAGPRSQ